MKSQDEFVISVLQNTIKVKALNILQKQVNREYESLLNVKLVSHGNEFSNSLNERIDSLGNILMTLGKFNNPDEVIQQLPEELEDLFKKCLISVISDIITKQIVPELKEVKTAE